MQDSAPAHSTLAADLRFTDVVMRVAGVSILDGVSLAFTPGTVTALLGPNGSGKTTLLKMAMGLMVPTAGHVAAPDPSRLALVLQKPVMLRRSAAANLAFALKAAGQPADVEAVRERLAAVGLAHLADRPARRLSGGEQQRLALARALARRPEILLLDEPTASLDPAATKAVEEIVARAVEAGVMVVIATHDLMQARRLAGQVVLLIAGRVAEQAPAERFFARPASEVARRFLAGEIIL